MFLEVKFHDNDFGMAFIEVLKDIWKTVKRESYREEERTVSEIFEFLNNKGILKEMIVRLVSLQTVKEHLLWAASDMAVQDKYYQEPEWLKNNKAHDVDLDFYLRYMSNIELEFHETGEFAMRNENSEHFWLDMETGNVGFF